MTAYSVDFITGTHAGSGPAIVPPRGVDTIRYSTSAGGSATAAAQRTPVTLSTASAIPPANQAR